MWGRNSNKAAWQLDPGKDFIKKAPDFINFFSLFYLVGFSSLLSLFLYKLSRTFISE